MIIRFSSPTVGGTFRYFFELISQMARLPNVGVSLFQGLHINQYGPEKARSEYLAFFGVRRPPVGGMPVSTKNIVDQLDFSNAAQHPCCARRVGDTFLLM